MEKETENKEQLNELKEIIESENKSPSNKLLYGMFLGLIITIIGIVMLLAGQRGAVSEKIYHLGFKVGIAGIIIYWIFRLIYLYKNKILDKTKKEK